MRTIINCFIFYCIVTSITIENVCSKNYLWEKSNQHSFSITDSIPVPAGYVRSKVYNNSFADWLRNLPLMRLNSKIHTYLNYPKVNQSKHHAIIDIDVGNKDLQQCADAVIRLKAEYLYAQQNYDSITFNFTSGDSCQFRKWIQGYRPFVNINKVSWKETEKPDSSYRTFRQYLNTVFMYAGSYSLQNELLPKRTIENLNIGDIFIQGGFPGHAVIVVDVAKHQTKGTKIFLLAQSYMPAQDIHVLKNPADSNLSPWYSVQFQKTLKTPDWIFTINDLYSFK